MSTAASITDEIGVNIFIEPLSKEHFFDEFDCEHQDTTDFLKDDALRYQNENIAVSWVVKDKFNVVLGYVTLSMAAIKANIPKIKLDGVSVRQYPALKIGRIGVTKEHKHRKIGKLLIMIATWKAKDLQDVVGCRHLIVDSYFDRITFYEQFGFERVESKPSGDTTKMFLLVSDV